MWIKVPLHVQNLLEEKEKEEIMALFGQEPRMADIVAWMIMKLRKIEKRGV